MKKIMKIVFTGGGSGGHTFPIIAIAREIEKKYSQEIKIYYLGPKNGIGFKLLSQENIKIKTIMAGKLRRYITPSSLISNFIDIFFKFPFGFLQSFFGLFYIAPDIIFSKGGYGSIPVVIAGWLLRIPIFIHESDTVPGLANKIAARFATEIFVSFPVNETSYFPKNKMLSLGNPIRNSLFGGSVNEAQKIFNLKGDKPIILVLGGSQGAQYINEVILGAIPDILKDFEIIHQCGQNNFKEINAQVSLTLNPQDKQYYHLFPFLDEQKLKNAYYVSNLVISRAGSGAIFEIAAFGKPSILVPLPSSAQNHQLKNAYAYQKAGACVLIEEPNFKPYFLIEKLRYLFSHPEELDIMAENAKKFSRPRAANVIANYLTNYLSFKKVDESH